MYLTPICLGNNLNVNQILLHSSQSAQFHVYYKGIKDHLSAKQFASLLDISVYKQNCFVCVVESCIEVSGDHSKLMMCFGFSVEWSCWCCVFLVLF